LGEGLKCNRKAEKKEERGQGFRRLIEKGFITNKEGDQGYSNVKKKGSVLRET